MAIKLIANYSKRLGLPGYSSHQFSVSLETELVTTDDVPGAAENLYRLLQSNVDAQILFTGFVPPVDYGMNEPAVSYARCSKPRLEQPVSGDVDDPPVPAVHWQRGPAWKCSSKQRELILQLVGEHELHKDDVEALAVARFGKGVRLLNKVEASGLIDELLDHHGGAGRREA